MILADTSAWVEFDRATGSAIDVALRAAMAGDELAVTEPVLMELLAGARDEKRADDLRRLLTSFGWLAADPVADFEGAARIYRQCRAAGFTPSGQVQHPAGDPKRPCPGRRCQAYPGHAAKQV